MIIPNDRNRQLQQEISCCNWPDAYPYQPKVAFSAWHDDEYLYLTYKVEEKYTKAEESTFGKEVYMDSCVECFIQPDPEDPHYYNFEWNAIGLLAMGCRTGRSDAEPAPVEVLKQVVVVPSLGSQPFAERIGDNRWTLEVRIPVTALFHHDIDKWTGKDMKINLYKCGDGLTEPHYLTYAPISTENPDYHRPEFFVPVHFE